MTVVRYYEYGLKIFFRLQQLPLTLTLSLRERELFRYFAEASYSSIMQLLPLPSGRATVFKVKYLLLSNIGDSIVSLIL